MKVVILYGYPASGKLTVGKELIKILPKLDRAVLKIDNSNLSATETAQLIKDKLSL